MIKYLVLPKIGLNMVDGTIVEWLVKPGDRVEKDQMVLRAETDKAVQDIFATESGTVLKLLRECGDTIPCQERIAVLGDEGDIYEPEPETAAAPTVTALTESMGRPASATPTKAMCAASSDAGRLRISPLARKVAKELGIDPRELSPAEPGKRIVKADVEKYRDSCVRRVSFKEDEFVPYSRMRRAIASHMTECVNTKPKVSLVTTVDCENLIKLRERLRQRQKVSYNEILAKACAKALRQYPALNAVTCEGGIIVKGHVNIAVAVDTEQGLLVPVLRDADIKSVYALSDELNKLVDKVKSGNYTVDDITGGSFTITNLGMFGVESFDPIMNSPECFILGVGCMKKEPAVVDNAVCVRTRMQLSLSFDHAAFDGGTAAKLLKAIKENIEEPWLIWME